MGLVGVGTSSCGSRLPHPGVDRFHQVLKVWKDVGVGLVAMLGYHLTIYNDVKLAVGSRGKLEVGDMLPGPAQGFACHPGSAEGMPSIPAVEDFQLQLLALSQSTPPTTVNANSMIWPRAGGVNRWDWAGASQLDSRGIIGLTPIGRSASGSSIFGSYPP